MMLQHIQHTKTMGAVEYTEGTQVIKAEKDVAPNVKEIGKVVVVAVHSLI